MRNIITTICFCLLVCTMSSAQAGLHLYGGVSMITNQSEILLPDGPGLGYHIGGDLRLNEGGMYFLLGGKYTAVPYTTNDALHSKEADPSLQMFNTRIGLGFTLFRISEQFKIRGKLLGSIDYLFNTPLKPSEVNPGFEDYDNINSTASMVGGLGVSLGPILVDLEYGYGIFNLVSNVKETIPSHLSLSVGTFF